MGTPLLPLLWREQGIFERLLAETHRRADACGELDWLTHFVDGSVVRACSTPPALPPRRQEGNTHPQDQALGRSRSGLSTKLHLRIDGGGR